MFRILIVEDQTEKLRNTLQILKKIESIDTDSIEHAIDSLSAKRLLKSNNYDLLILDIAIPLRKEDPIDPEGGLKLLTEIKQRQVYKLPSHIIGLTGRDDIFAKASNEFEENLLSVIRYSETDLEWQGKLLKGVEHRVEAKKALESAETGYNFDLAIITAVDREFEAIKNLSNSWEPLSVKGDSTIYYQTVFENTEKRLRVVATCATQMGMNASAVLTMKMIYNFRPRYIFMTGIAASVKNSHVHGYGDVIIIDECWDGGAGKLTEDKDGSPIFLPIASHLRLDTDVSQNLRKYKNDTKLLREIKDKWAPNVVPNTELNIHIGSVVSVAGVVENKAIIDELSSKDRKLLGLEMEAYGFYYSCYNCSKPKPIAVAMKSVSDFANTEKNDLYQAYASYTSAALMREFVMSYVEAL